MSKNKIPSEEAFRRAKELMRAREKGLSEVRRHVLSNFGEKGVHECVLFYSEKDAIGAIIFYDTNQRILEAEADGTTQKLQDSIIEELEKAGRGPKEKIKITYEFDSHENVKKHFNGNYFLRLR